MERFYRQRMISEDLKSFRVVSAETDLYVSSDGEVESAVRKAVGRCRGEIEGYIAKRPEFRESLKPIPMRGDEPQIVADMIRSSSLSGVGPMAGVAGAIAEYVGRECLGLSKEVIIENGGDIFMKTEKQRRVAVYAGASPLSERLFIKIRPEQTPLGICTSSGTVGPSISLGKADACVIVSSSATLSDCAATATCNRVQTGQDIEAALDFGCSIRGVTGALIIIGKDLGIKGDIELI